METLPLRGRRIVVTRPEAQSAGLCATLTAAGAVTMCWPLLAIVPESEAVLAALPAQLAACDWAIFISPSAVDVAWTSIAGRLPERLQLAAVGRPTAQRLMALSGRPVLFPENGDDSRALLAEPALAQMAGLQCALVKGHGGRPELAETLRARGAVVHALECYSRQKPVLNWAIFDDFSRDGLDAVILTSREAVDHLFSDADALQRTTLQSTLFVVPHPRIAACLAGWGAGHILETRAGDGNLVSALAAWFVSTDER